MSNNLYNNKIFTKIYDKYNPPNIDIWQPVNDFFNNLYSNYITKYWYFFVFLFFLIIYLAYRYNNKKEGTKLYKNIPDYEYNKIYTEPKIDNISPRMIKTALNYNI